MVNLNECTALLDATRALGVEPPASLAEVPPVFEALVRAQQAYRNPGEELVKAYNAGTLTAATAGKTLAKVSGVVAEAQAARDAIIAVEPAMTADFVERIKADAGAELISAIRPVFDAAVDGLAEVADVLPAEVTAEQVLTLEDPRAAELWRAQPGYARTLDQIYNTVLHPLVHVFGATAARAFDDLRLPVIAYVIDPAGSTDLYRAVSAIGNAPMTYGRGGRWRALTSKGFRLRLNTPTEATALLTGYLDDVEHADTAHTAALREKVETRMHLEHVGAVAR